MYACEDDSLVILCAPKKEMWSCVWSHDFLECRIGNIAPVSLDSATFLDLDLGEK